MSSYTYIKTVDLKLVCALLSMGVQIKKQNGAIKTIGAKGKEEFLFLLKTESDCGQYETKDLVLAWENPDFVKDNPEHPFSYIKAYVGNMEVLLDYVKQLVPFIQIKQGKKTLAIAANASKETQDKLFKML